MSYLILQDTPIAQWHALITEAEEVYGQCLHEDLESYLVFLLQRFIQKPEFVGQILGLEYLKSCHYFSQEKQGKLRDVGDACLLFAGLFPESAAKRNVSVSYYVDLGRTAYSNLADLLENTTSFAELYVELGIHFVAMMDLLHCMRELGGERFQLLPELAKQLWQETGSPHALAVLRNYQLIDQKMH